MSRGAMVQTEQAKSPVPRWLTPADIAGWAWLLAVGLFLAFFLLPRKGVEFSDEGWVLSASLAAARGWRLNLVVPQAPMWLLNFLAMAVGVDSYLAMRWFFYGLISACLALALWAVEPKRNRSGLKAILVTCAGLTTLSSLVSYNTTPQYLILAGASMLLLLRTVRARWGRVCLAVIAGLSLAVGGFLNFTMYPAAVLSLILVWQIGGRPRSAWVALMTLAVCAGGGIGWYLHRIGMENLLRHPGGHGIQVHRLWVAVRLVLEWLVPAAFARACVSFLFRSRQDDERLKARHEVAAALVLTCSLVFLGALLTRLGVCDLTTWLAPLFKSARAIGLGGLAGLSQGVPGAVIAVWGVAVLVIASTLCLGRDDVSRHVLVCAGCLYLCYLWQEFFSLMDPFHLPVYYAGPCLALGLYLILRTGSVPARWLGGAALGITLAAGILFSVFYNHPFPRSVLGHKVPLPLRKLAGLRDSPERAQTLQRLAEAFEKYDCRNRTLVTFQATPLLYYLFEVEPPRGLEYIYVPYIFDSDLVVRTLEQSPRWCVFVSWNWLDWPGERNNKARTAPLLEYLEHHSESSIRLCAGEKQTDPYGDFVLYLGPATGTNPSSKPTPGLFP